MGGKMVLVDTSKPIQEWHESYVAKRDTPWAEWRISKNLA
jgi:hypothetical protein